MLQLKSDVPPKKGRRGCQCTNSGNTSEASPNNLKGSGKQQGLGNPIKYRKEWLPMY